MALRDQIEKLRNYFVEDDEEFEDEPVRPQRTSVTSTPQAATTTAKAEEKPATAPASTATATAAPAQARPAAPATTPSQKPQGRRSASGFSRPRQERSVQQQTLNPTASQTNTSQVIAIKEPRAYNDIMEAARIVKNGEAVLVNFKFMTDSQARRSIDFLTGVVFTIDGDIQNVTGQLFVVTPASVAIDVERQIEALTEGYDPYK
ncbi:cell division protein SepF [Lactococcus termiticola]|uniref:Cell division protein SepF n=1 Tax=Lactococcus termiticola TaxID=2169526 RepID=A0A2R5HJY2_9LACT|nr:cell division protein SepF [Lactococcus termiticola]GBG97018.1 cell division protein SepF [Lactococcus termiticola]